MIPGSLIARPLARAWPERDGGIGKHVTKVGAAPGEKSGACRPRTIAHEGNYTIASNETHKDKIIARYRAYYEANKQAIGVAVRTRQLKRRYGISPADYEALLANQGRVCAICRRPSKRQLCVDHCHSTGKIRGLLCRWCNIALGCLKEDQTSLITALAYLGAMDRNGFGSAARRALLARAALPSGPARKAILTEVRLPFASMPRRARCRAASAGGR
jgi:hypothetical protein